MKLILFLFLLSGIIISGCIGNPTKQVPVVHVNITYVEKQGFSEVENHKLTQGTVSYLARPKTIQPESFPAITARTMIVKGKNSTIGPWEALPYNGNGTYSFNIGFREDNYPIPNDKVNIYIYVWGKKGEIIGHFEGDMVWE
ncbi:MAG TPA: hypothetical protein VF354_01030 [Candidatus Methanoperedens sp.]